MSVARAVWNCLGLSRYTLLKEVLTQPLNQSERILQQHFDPERINPLWCGPDRAELARVQWKMKNRKPETGNGKWEK